jgi:3-deoxy-7-phosphoheptulonate synthase
LEDKKMIIMNTDATQEQIDQVVKEIGEYGLRAAVITGAYRTVIGLVGDEEKIPFDHFAVLPGVKEARMVDIPYKLISREYSKLFGGLEHMVVKVGALEIGGEEPVFIAGPCAVESKESRGSYPERGHF